MKGLDHGGPGTYAVVQGDTLGEIAKDNDIHAKKLLELNPDIADPDVIEVGEIINLPGAPQPITGIPAGPYPGMTTRPGQGIDDVPTGPYPGMTTRPGQGPSYVPTVPYPGMTTRPGQGPSYVPTTPYPGTGPPHTPLIQPPEPRGAAGGVPGTTQFTSGEAEGIATFVQLFTGLLSGAGDVALPISPDLDMFMAEITNAQFPAIEIDVIPRFNWEGGDWEGPRPNSLASDGQGGTLQGPQTSPDRSDDRRHSNSRTIVRADVDEGGSLSSPLGAPTFGI